MSVAGRGGWVRLWIRLSQLLIVTPMALLLLLAMELIAVPLFIVARATDLFVVFLAFPPICYILIRAVHAHFHEHVVKRVSGIWTGVIYPTIGGTILGIVLPALSMWLAAWLVDEITLTRSNEFVRLSPQLTHLVVDAWVAGAVSFHTVANIVFGLVNRGLLVEAAGMDENLMTLVWVQGAVYLVPIVLLHNRIFRVERMAAEV